MKKTPNRHLDPTDQGLIYEGTLFDQSLTLEVRFTAKLATSPAYGHLIFLSESARLNGKDMGDGNHKPMPYSEHTHTVLETRTKYFFDHAEEYLSEALFMLLKEAGVFSRFLYSPEDLFDAPFDRKFYTARAESAWEAAKAQVKRDADGARSAAINRLTEAIKEHLRNRYKEVLTECQQVGETYKRWRKAFDKQNRRSALTEEDVKRAWLEHAKQIGLTEMADEHLAMFFEKKEPAQVAYWIVGAENRYSGTTVERLLKPSSKKGRTKKQ